MPDQTEDELYLRTGALQQTRRFAEAAEIYQDLANRALTLRLAVNLGVCLGELGEHRRAIGYLERAARHSPGQQPVRRALAGAYAEAGALGPAEREFRAALDLDPQDKTTQLAFAGFCLSLGRYAEAWPLFDARVELNPGVIPPVAAGFPEWRGEPIEGRSVLVWVEQGFGDKIQMARFTNTLKARGAARVVLGCNPPLTHLFTTLAGADELVTVAVGQAVEVDRCDYWTRYFSLPARLGVTLETLPAEPYLSAPPDRLAHWRGFGDGARIGLAWKASPTGFNAANKGLPDDLARRLLDAGAVSLQPEDTGAADFADTAAIIAGLDLVISIDTSVAHLAGAMGKSCWTLLPQIHCDWRWLRGRSDCPWYPTMRLYRQTAPRDWTQTVEQVIADLAADGLGPGLGAP
jgi:tetratricopeptide (TPR) repeat protein